MESYLVKMCLIQENIIEYVDTSDYDKYHILNNQCQEEISKNDLFIILHMISSIVRFHHQHTNFYKNIFKIMSIFNDCIKQMLNKNEIIQIFKDCEPILFFLITKNILSKNDIKLPSLNENLDKILNDDYEEKLTSNEHDQIILNLIRKDSIDEFSSYCEKCNYTNNQCQSMTINSIKGNLSLIEYSAFFGSLGIFQHLILNREVDYYSSIWEYLVQGNNPEFIHSVERQDIERNKLYKKNGDLRKLFKISVKCHHNGIARYISEDSDNSIVYEDCCPIFKHYNFDFIQQINNFDNEMVFYYLCKYNYVDIVRMLLETIKVDINQIIKISINSFI